MQRTGSPPPPERASQKASGHKAPKEDFIGASRWRVWSSPVRYVDALTAVARSAIASSLSETWGYSHNHFSFRFPTRHHQAGVRGRSRHRKQGFPPQRHRDTEQRPPEALRTIVPPGHPTKRTISFLFSVSLCLLCGSPFPCLLRGAAADTDPATPSAATQGLPTRCVADSCLCVLGATRCLLAAFCRGPQPALALPTRPSIRRRARTKPHPENECRHSGSGRRRIRKLSTPPSSLQASNAWPVSWQ